MPIVLSQLCVEHRFSEAWPLLDKKGMNISNNDKVAWVPSGGKKKWVPVITVDTPRGAGGKNNST